METAPLKSFATSARTELIREVGARMTAVLPQGSPERIEQPRAVAALERAIARAGGGDKGKAYVADKVAYTWFNRIIALRFMDANSYTGIGVVSPAADQVGQPEVLAAAKRGQIDGEVVKGTDAAIITGLLNGTRPPRTGVGAQAEAYALLLTDYCRYWNSAMPFIFEREGDYTELLIPTNLLAEDSALSRSVKVLTKDVCLDVEVIGWLYQFYISERKDEVFAGFKKNKKAGADEIPAATQLFTPHWIVRYLVENSVGRLWMLNHPGSRLVDQMDYYIAPVDEETDFLKVTTPEELKVIDPACGSGHMLTYAFDLLYAIYEEEGYTPSQIPGLILTNNLYGTEIDPRAGALAAFALTMKAAAKRKLFLKNAVEPNICVLEPITFAPHELDYLVTKDGDRHAEETFWNQFAEADIFGSLIRPDPDLTTRLAKHLATLDGDGDLLRVDAVDRAQHIINQATCLTRDYAVVVANPPYMGSANMAPELVQFAKQWYPVSKFDLMTMFMERGWNLLGQRGSMAMITLSSWMFTKDARRLREHLLEATTIRSLLHLGRGVFGSDYGSVAFVTVRGHIPSALGVYRKLYERHVAVRRGEVIRDLFLDEQYGRHVLAQNALEALPGKVFAYWIDPVVAEVFSRFSALGDHFNAGNGITTSDNERFLRLWWEVDHRDIGYAYDGTVVKRRWMPLNKGGARRKWSGNRDYLLDWNLEGKELFDLRPASTMRNVAEFFRPTVSWSDVCNGPLAARRYGTEFAFESAANSAFVEDGELSDLLLAYCNSSFAAEVSLLLNPGAHYKVGDFKAMPFLRREDDGWQVEVQELVQISDDDLATHELDRTFQRDQLLGRGTHLGTCVEMVRAYWEARVNRVVHLEELNNSALSATYGLPSRFAGPPSRADVTLRNNPEFEYRKSRATIRAREWVRSRIGDFISYAVGCMFGRYSLDEPGLILAGQGERIEDYLAKIPSPTFVPDADNVIPIIDGDWFEDDIVQRFRQFIRVAFGEQNFDLNLRYVNESLGVNDIRDYFMKSFVDDHIQRYKKRPIYWLFSSPEGSFNALIYMHRYTPSTVSTVLTYLREHVTKLESALQQAERAGNAKEADRLRKIVVELNEYEHDTLYPKASENVIIDLDDGVKANYPKFGAALKKIPGLETASD
ncbi:BREX-1 system adenine-specific DNA-methyltransferase PglX [Nocardia fluminea]|uniref:BREX-1 system adenine-specific DNA-methyltransferase PglX n=1 Tax=Nocardia fluminea TaxID=134984 RepID=UPI00378DD281